jgi:hypothetical protein
MQRKEREKRKGEFQTEHATNAPDFESLKMTPGKAYHTLADVMRLEKAQARQNGKIRCSDGLRANKRIAFSR